MKKLVDMEKHELYHCLEAVHEEINDCVYDARFTQYHQFLEYQEKLFKVEKVVIKELKKQKLYHCLEAVHEEINDCVYDARFTQYHQFLEYQEKLFKVEKVVIKELKKRGEEF